MRGRTRTLAAGMVAVAALAVDAGSALGAEVSIDPGKKSVVFGHGTISIDGKLTPDAGTAAGGHKVTLLESRYPYKKTQKVRTATTDDKGGYRFGRVKPLYNTRYRVAVKDPGATARSKAKLVVVNPDIKQRLRATRGRRAVSSFRIRTSSKLPLNLNGAKVLWYFRKLGDKSFDVVERTRAKQPHRGLVKGRVSFPLPGGGYRFQVSFCLETPKRRDIGSGPPSSRRGCPRSYRARSRLARAPIPNSSAASAAPAQSVGRSGGR